MARLWYDSAGNALALARTDDEEAQLFPAGGPPGAAGSLSFDESANQSVLDALDGRGGFLWQDHTVAAGVLKRKGVAVTLAADTAERTARLAVKNQAAALLTALRAGTATTAQIQRALAYLLSQELKRN